MALIRGISRYINRGRRSARTVPPSRTRSQGSGESALSWTESDIGSGSYCPWWFWIGLLVLVLAVLLTREVRIIAYRIGSSMAVELIGTIGMLPDAFELTPENWDRAVAGKQVLVMFHSHRCPHCRKLKPKVNMLASDYKDSPHALVALVNCLGEGRALCEKHRLKHLPALFWGDPYNLQKYPDTAPRTASALRQRARIVLRPSCSPFNIKACNDKGLAALKAVQKMSDGDLDRVIAAKEKRLKWLQEEMDNTTEQKNVMARQRVLEAKQRKYILRSQMSLAKTIARKRKRAKDAEGEF